jgi:hypothetical protein
MTGGDGADNFIIRGDDTILDPDTDDHVHFGDPDNLICLTGGGPNKGQIVDMGDGRDVYGRPLAGYGTLLPCTRLQQRSGAKAKPPVAPFAERSQRAAFAVRHCFFQLDLPPNVPRDPCLTPILARAATDSVIRPGHPPPYPPPQGRAIAFDVSATARTHFLHAEVRRFGIPVGATGRACPAPNAGQALPVAPTRFLATSAPPRLRAKRRPLGVRGAGRFSYAIALPP